MNVRQGFLLLTAVALFPVALSYGVDPARSLGLLFDVSVSNVNGTHMFRAIMGLYLAMALFWVAGAFRAPLRQPALWSVLVFMLGLAAGRALSLAIDGMPHWLLVGYLLVELVLGAIAWRLLKRPD
jgi:Domain of unknown function (DUF4345)